MASRARAGGVVAPTVDSQALGTRRVWTAQIHSNSPCEDTMFVGAISAESAFVGVFDGHGGRACADWCAEKVRVSTPHPIAASRSPASQPIKQSWEQTGAGGCAVRVCMCV